MNLVLHLLLLTLLPPLMGGVIGRVRALVAGRRGPPLLQPYYELVKLAQKSAVISPTTSWVFLAGPVVGLTTALVAGLMLPLGAASAPLSFTGDLVAFAYLLGLGRFFTSAAALDTGSAFEGMGAAREATYSALIEPALLLGMMALVLSTGSTSLAALLGGGAPSPLSVAGAPLLLVGVSLFLVLLAENSRVPFDDPATHLELTMVHEVMVLDHSGPLLGLIQYGAWVKLTLFAAILVRLLLPLGWGPAWADWALLPVGVVVVAAGIGAIESSMARTRLLLVPRMLVSACLLSAFGLLLLAR
ncbi:MAG: NADH-quinone oxidoreductase subunit H [Deltaproteobacteria bacterium]|nr:NADH-quinone oxidoreductase subunit H [Deltaproteobacteria bacterium]